ncbi:hypothetical protein [Streptomyces sp. NPDC088719]|uniref:hypothetical protein n=1 Tax=Streptomyces sp. NPDC088719 TaxID=3365872 RepID=UPI003829F58E
MSLIEGQPKMLAIRGRRLSHRSVSGTTSADELAAAGADLVLEDLTDQRRVVDSIRGLAG